METMTPDPGSRGGAPGYATVGGLRLYHEVHGEGRPLVLLPGGFMTLEALGPLLPALAADRRVIAVELEGHGRTADLDRPLSVDQMAHDVAGLIEQLGLGAVDLFGFSLGGMAALRLAILHPERVRKLVVVSAGYGADGFYPATMVGWPSMSAKTFAGSPAERAYLDVAPQPERWAGFVDKVKLCLMGSRGWPLAEVAAIKATVLLALGDADLVRPEHALEMFRLLGGARPDGGLEGPTASQLAVLPGATHFDILDRPELTPMVARFLDAE